MIEQTAAIATPMVWDVNLDHLRCQPSMFFFVKCIGTLWLLYSMHLSEKVTFLEYIRTTMGQRTDVSCSKFTILRFMD